MESTLSPQQLAQEGKDAYQKGNYLEAAQVFQKAGIGYASGGDLLSSAEMANNRSVALLQAGNAQEAFLAVDGTDEVFAAAGDTHRQAMALGNRAEALKAMGRPEEAMASYEKAADLFKQIGEHDLRAPLLEALGALQMKTGKHLQGLANVQAGLNEIEQPTSQQKTLKSLLSQILHRLGL
jgi:tetratricopeptide (TPR) repeat protein